VSKQANHFETKHAKDFCNKICHERTHAAQQTTRIG
jgi:hypothetical protein